MRRRGVSLVGVVYLVIGLVVAGTNGNSVAWNIPGNIIEGLAAIVLWPLVVFGVDLHTLIAEMYRAVPLVGATTISAGARLSPVEGAGIDSCKTGVLEFTCL